MALLFWREHLSQAFLVHQKLKQNKTKKGIMKIWLENEKFNSDQGSIQM
jgi:hypothetical protein